MRALAELIAVDLVVDFLSGLSGIQHWTDEERSRVAEQLLEKTNGDPEEAKKLFLHAYINQVEKTLLEREVPRR